MQSRLVCVFVACVGTLGYAQSGSSDPFDVTNQITLNGAVIGISSWSGTRGPEAFLVFEVPDNAGRPQRWASRVAAIAPVQRGEQVVVTGFPARRKSLQDLLPYSAVPMLAPIARAGRVLRATRIARSDGTELATPQAASTSAPIFRITTDEFWLNLHHFRRTRHARRGAATPPREDLAGEVVSSRARSTQALPAS